MKQLTRTLKLQLLILGGLLLTFWALETVDVVLLHQALNRYGIVPRTQDGLWGILFAPFLHGGFPHLIANSVPFLVLGWLVLVRGVKDFLAVSLVTVLVAGLGTWLVGAAGTVHIGASGVVFGYLGYLMLRGFFERKILSILLSIGVGYLYGRYLPGVLPGQQGISWECHLFGFLGGALAAWLMTRSAPRAHQS
ncbi:MAG: rhomboid family intramembrane serine protease [Candidatus Eremiobacterota bacterium]